MNRAVFQKIVASYFPKLCTGSTQLRFFAAENDEELFSLVDRQRAHLRPWLLWVEGTRSIDDSSAFIRKATREREEAKALHLGIWDHGRITGAICLYSFDWENRKANLGYWLSADAQGKKVMTAACRTLVDFAMVALELDRVEIDCAAENVKSRAVAKRLGFQQEETSAGTHDLTINFGRVMYVMLAEKWGP